MQAQIEDMMEKEEIRGANPRYWEDVNVGDTTQPLVKGPLGVGEMMAWAHSIGGGGEVHAFKVRSLRKHPAWAGKTRKREPVKPLTRCMSRKKPPRDRDPGRLRCRRAA